MAAADVGNSPCVLQQFLEHGRKRSEMIVRVRGISSLENEYGLISRVQDGDSIL